MNTKGFGTLKAAVEVIPNAFEGGVSEEPLPQSTLMLRVTDRVLDLAAQRRKDHRPEQTVLFAPAHRDFLSAQYPAVGWITRCQRGYRGLHSRPCGQGGACWLWQSGGLSCWFACHSVERHIGE